MLECLYLISLCDRMSSCSAHMLILRLGLFAYEQQSEGGCVGDCASAAFACVSLPAFKYMQECAQLKWVCGSQNWVSTWCSLICCRGTCFFFCVCECVRFSTADLFFFVATMRDFLCYFPDRTQPQSWQVLGCLAGLSALQTKAMIFTRNSWVSLGH